MGVFENLASPKRQKVIDSAMQMFAVHGYRKASVADIARQAGVSKAMIFTYFGSKKGCYEFMCNQILQISITECKKYEKQLFEVADFFERIMLTVKIKMDILKKCPSLLAFGASMYMESDEEVLPIKNRIIADGFTIRESLLSTGMDLSKFKNPDDAERVAKITEWMAMGCVEEWMRSKTGLEGLFLQFIEQISMLKRYLYKEEYV